MHFSVTARKDKAITTTTIASIGRDAPTTIHYPRSVFDEQNQLWISDVEVAETEFFAFTSKPKTRRAGPVDPRRV